MDQSMIALLISLVSGAAGGNIVGQLLKNVSLGTAGNSVVGLLGGALGSYLPVIGPLLLSIAGPTIGSAASGGVGGGVLVAIIGIIRSMMKK